MNLGRSHLAASAARRPVISPVPEGVARPFWSVMIPTYNSTTRLARTLEGVLAQDPGPAEMQIRVIDDASTVDDPSFVVRDVAGSRVSVWRQARNVGAPINFTTCVQQSVGHWVHILHSDDLVLPGFYASYRRHIERHECAMAAGRSYYVDDDEQILSTSPAVVTEDGLLVDPMRVIAREHPFNFVSIVVHRAVYETLGGFDPALKHANDWEMWTRVAAHGPVAILDESLAMYRRHADSDTERLIRSTTFADDVSNAIEIIAERFDDPREGRDFRNEARRRCSQSAVRIIRLARHDRRLHLAWANTWRALLLDPRLETARSVWDVVVSPAESDGGKSRGKLGRR